MSNIGNLRIGVNLDTTSLNNSLQELQTALKKA